MNNGWKTKRFSEVLEIRNGKNQREVLSDSGTYPIYGSAGNVMGMATDFICEAGATIIGRKGNINSPVFTDTAFWNVDTAFGLSALRELDSKFLFYFCLTYDFGALNRGTTIPSLVKSELLEIEIPVPPLPEQQRIVGVLDEAVAGLATAQANAEKNLQNARALFESHLHSVFTQRGEGWKNKPLGVVAEVQSGGTPSVPKKQYWGGNIPWYSSGELNRTYTTDPERKISEEGLNNSNAKLFPKGSLLIGMYDTAALKMSILDRDGTFNQAIAGVRPNEKIDVAFILHAINVIKPILLLERRGVRQKNLSLGKIKEITIPMPELAEQRAIVSSLTKLFIETQRLETIYQQKLAALVALKKSLLHQAFTGEL